MIDIDELIEEANDLTPLSTTAVRLSRLLCEENYHLDDVVELISFDQSLTLKLLRAANSAANGRSIPVGTVDEAVQRIGAAQILAFTIAANVRPYLTASVPAYNLFEGALWRHSVATATCVEMMHAYTKVPVPPEAFTAALLHDVGKLVLGRHLTSDILGFLQTAKRVDHLNESQAESLLLEVEHAELGGLIAQHWKLPSLVVLGITYHHNPEQGFHSICDITYAANLLAKSVEAEIENRSIEVQLLPEVAERLGLAPEVLKKLSTQSTERFTKINARYNAA